MTPYDLRSSVDFSLMGLGLGLFVLSFQGLVRMRKLWVLLVALALTVPLSAQFSYKKTATEVTVAGVSISLFSSSDVQAGNGHPQATQATCSLSGANIRVTYDGTTPTTSLGLVLTPGVYVVTGPDVMLNMLGIRDDSTSATWNCDLVGQ